MRQNCWERHRINLMTRVPFPGSYTIPWPLPLCRRCSPHPVLAPACRIGSVNTRLSEGSRGFFFPGCMLKAALPSAQPVLHPQQLNTPTQCPNSVGSSTKVCMGTQICRIKAFIHATNTHQGASMFIKHLKFPRQLTDYICKEYCQSGQSLGKHFL